MLPSEEDSASSSNSSSNSNSNSNNNNNSRCNSRIFVESDSNSRNTLIRRHSDHFNSTGSVPFSVCNNNDNDSVEPSGFNAGPNEPNGGSNGSCSNGSSSSGAETIISPLCPVRVRNTPLSRPRSMPNLVAAVAAANALGMPPLPQNTFKNNCTPVVLAGAGHPPPSGRITRAGRKSVRSTFRNTISPSSRSKSTHNIPPVGVSSDGKRLPPALLHVEKTSRVAAYASFVQDSQASIASVLHTEGGGGDKSKTSTSTTTTTAVAAAAAGTTAKSSCFGKLNRSASSGSAAAVPRGGNGGELVWPLSGTSAPSWVAAPAASSLSTTAGGSGTAVAATKTKDSLPPAALTQQDSGSESSSCLPSAPSGCAGGGGGNAAAGNSKKFLASITRSSRALSISRRSSSRSSVSCSPRGASAGGGDGGGGNRTKSRDQVSRRSRSISRRFSRTSSGSSSSSGGSGGGGGGDGGGSGSFANTISGSGESSSPTGDKLRPTIAAAEAALVAAVAAEVPRSSSSSSSPSSPSSSQNNPGSTESKSVVVSPASFASSKHPSHGSSEPASISPTTLPPQTPSMAPNNELMSVSPSFAEGKMETAIQPHASPIQAYSSPEPALGVSLSVRGNPGSSSPSADLDVSGKLETAGQSHASERLEVSLHDASEKVVSSQNGSEEQLMSPPLDSEKLFSPHFSVAEDVGSAAAAAATSQGFQEQQQQQQPQPLKKEKGFVRSSPSGLLSLPPSSSPRTVLLLHGSKCPRPALSSSSSSSVSSSPSISAPSISAPSSPSRSQDRQGDDGCGYEKDSGFAFEHERSDGGDHGRPDSDKCVTHDERSTVSTAVVEKTQLASVGKNDDFFPIVAGDDGRSDGSFDETRYASPNSCYSAREMSVVGRSSFTPAESGRGEGRGYGLENDKSEGGLGRKFRMSSPVAAAAVAAGAAAAAAEATIGLAPSLRDEEKVSTSSATSADDVEMDIVLQVSGDSGTSTGSEGTRRGIWPQGRGGQEGEEGEGKRGRGGVGGRGFGELSRILSSAMKQSGSTALSWSCSVDELVEAFSRARGRAKEIWPLGSARAAAELGGLLRQAILGDWHTCAMPKRAPPRWKVKERSEWDAWMACEGVTKTEAMRLFATAVDELYRQRQEGEGEFANMSGGGLKESEDIWSSPILNASKPKDSFGNDININIDVRSDIADGSVGGLALSAAPLFGDPGSRVGGLEGLARDGGDGVGVGGDESGVTTERDARDEAVGCSGGSVSLGSGRRYGGDSRGAAAERAKEAVSSVMTVRDATPAATLKERPTKSGVLYKKREVFPGWRPRTFMLDHRQRLLRYYLPNSTRPRASIPLDGCSVGVVSVGFDGKGESGPDGKRLFRIKLVACPSAPSLAAGAGNDLGNGGGGEGSTRRSFLGASTNSGDSEGSRKTYVLAATSPEEAQAWVTAIKETVATTAAAPHHSVEDPTSNGKSFRSTSGRNDQQRRLSDRPEDRSGAPWRTNASSGDNNNNNSDSGMGPSRTSTGYLFGDSSRYDSKHKNAAANGFRNVSEEDDGGRRSSVKYTNTSSSSSSVWSLPTVASGDSSNAGSGAAAVSAGVGATVRAANDRCRVNFVPLPSGVPAASAAKVASPHTQFQQHEKDGCPVGGSVSREASSSFVYGSRSSALSSEDGRGVERVVALTAATAAPAAASDLDDWISGARIDSRNGRGGFREGMERGVRRKEEFLVKTNRMTAFWSLATTPAAAAAAVSACWFVLMRLVPVVFSWGSAANGATLVTVAGMATGLLLRSRRGMGPGGGKWGVGDSAGGGGEGSATLDLDAKEHDEGEDSSRYSVSFVVDVKSLQAELDRLRRAAVALTAKEGNVGRVSALSSSSTLSAVPTNNHNLDNTSSTRRRSSGGGSRLSFPRGLFRNGAGSGSSDSNIWPLGRTGGDATTTTAVSADEDCYDGAGEVAAGASTRSTEAFGSAARNSFSSSVNTGPAPATSGDTAGVAPPSVTVLHLVMKAAAASLLEIMPSLPRVRRPCTAGQEELAVGLSERNAGDYGCEAAGSAAPKVFLAGGDSFNVGGCYGADVMATRVACAVSSLSSRGGLRVFGEGSRGEGRTRGGRSAGNGRDLVIVESAERKSAAAIATEIEQAGAIAAAAAGVVMAPILNAADNELSSFTRRDDGNHGDIASGSLLFQERVPLLHAEHSEATKAVISQVRPRFKVESHAAVDGRTGGGKIRRYAYRCANNALLGLEDSPEELRARWLEGELSYFAAAAAPAAVTASSAQAVGVTSATSATATTASTRKPQERVPLLHAADVSRLLASWDHRTGSWGSLEGGRLESGRRASAAGASVACMDCFVEMRPSAQRANTSATFATDSIGSTLSAVMEADPVSSGGGDDADKDGGGRSGRVTFAENTTFFTSGRLGSAGSSQKKDRRRRRSHHQRRQSSENSSFASLFRQKQEQARILSSSSRMSFSAAKQSQKEEVDDDDDDQDCDDQPLEVAVIPRPAGDGVEPLLRVIVGRVSALRCRGGGKGTGVSGSGEGAGGRGEMAAPPVIVLQVSVVGARAVGAGVTLGFAEALRRRLLAAGPDV